MKMSNLENPKWHTAAVLKKKPLYLHISVANRPNFDTAEETCKHKSEINIKKQI